MFPRVVFELDAQRELCPGSRRFRVVQLAEQMFVTEQFEAVHPGEWGAAPIAQPIAHDLNGALSQLFGRPVQIPSVG